MSSELLQNAKDILLAGGTIGGTYYGIRLSGRKNKVDASQAMFDQLQEERDAAAKQAAADRLELKEELKQARIEIAQLLENQRQSYQRELVRDDFIQELRNHIREGLGPPPPAWPEGLRRG